MGASAERTEPLGIFINIFAIKFRKIPHSSSP